MAVLLLPDDPSSKAKGVVVALLCVVLQWHDAIGGAGGESTAPVFPVTPGTGLSIGITIEVTPFIDVLVAWLLLYLWEGFPF